MGYYDDWVEPNGIFRSGVEKVKVKIQCPSCKKQATATLGQERNRSCFECGTKMKEVKK